MVQLDDLTRTPRSKKWQESHFASRSDPEGANSKDGVSDYMATKVHRAGIAETRPSLSTALYADSAN
ncbi:MAG: hypothetical protein ACI9Y1_000639, partial [Lentisphaeria bacterium]